MGKDFQEDYAFDNWAGTIKFNAARYCKPATYAELAAALEQSAAAKRRVRPVGSRHSWSLGVVPGVAAYEPGGAADGDLIDVSALSPENEKNDPGLKAVYFEHAGTPYVAVPPGATQGWLLKSAHENGKAVMSAGPAPTITLGGFVANGCHGSGWDKPLVSDTVDAIEIMSVDANGKAMRTVFVHDVELLPALYENGVVGRDALVSNEIDAARVSLGALGIITKLIIRLEDDYRFRVLDEYVDEDQLFPEGDDPDLSALEEVVTSSDYVMLFWFALNNYKLIGERQTNQLWVKRFKRTLEDPRETFKVVGMSELLGFLAKTFGARPGARIAKHPRLAPLILRRAWEFIKLTMWRRLKDPSFTADFEHPWRRPPIVHSVDAFLFQKDYFHNIMDFAYAFPIRKRADGRYDFSLVRKAYQEAVLKLYELADRNTFPITINIVLRFVSNSNSWLSPARQSDASTHTCFMECVTYREQDGAFLEFAKMIAPTWLKLGGRPHWAKRFDALPGAYEDAYNKLRASGDLERFNRVRERMDPDGMFQNDFLARLLTGQGAAPEEPEHRPIEGEPEEHEEPMHVIASKTLKLSPVVVADQDGIISNGKCQMRHDEGEAVMVDENGEGHAFTYRDTAPGERTYDLMTRPEHLTPDQVFERVQSIFTSTVFASEDDARAAVYGARSQDTRRIANAILIHNGTPRRLRLLIRDSWNGEFELLQPAEELDSGLWAATFHHEIRGSEGCVVYSLLNDDGVPVCDVFMAFSSPHKNLTRNRVHVEVREPGHWWSVGTKDHMQHLTRDNGAYDVSDSRSFGDVKVTVTGHVDKGNEPLTVFKLS